MKQKQSKKRWAWTEAQLRKTRSKGHYFYGGVPRWYCKTFDKQRKHKCKVALKQVMLGADPDDYYFQTQNHRHMALWYWW